MLKKIILLFILAAVAVSVSFYIFNDNEDADQKNQPPPEKKEQPPENEAEELDEADWIHDIYSLSKDGMIIGAPFVAGETKNDEIMELFGEPERVDKTSVGDYALYPNRHVTIGYRNSVAVDLRLNAAELKHIRYQEIIDALGEPSDIKYYKDENNHHIILIYEPNSKYQLKWILDNPTEYEPDPTVHHISVVATEYPEKELPVTISEVIENMSVEEKIGQMIFSSISGTELGAEEEKLIHQYKVGGIIVNKKNITSPSQMVAYMNSLKEENKNNVPLFFGIDQEGGRIAKLPGDLRAIPSHFEIGKQNDPSFALEIGTVLGKLVNSFGFNVNFAPVLDINSNPENPVIGDRSFGINPDVVSKLGIQMMKGIQGENIIPAIKHFPGHGDTSVDSHVELPVVQKTVAELEQMELIPFKQAIAEGADMVMIAHILLPSIDPKFPSSMSETIITELLREKIGFDGVVITDDMTMEAITNSFDIGKASVMSVKAGADIVMVAHEFENVVKAITALTTAVENGEITEERIDQSVERILKLKNKYSLKDKYNKEVNINELN
ncbi:hypothetical protein GCM10010978_30100 [Compostibacillus humi]|uniref:beta-N-acetylhexosaminidase n=1 Tax=Compostibacillus humi TaxID=1245525 RepID=A0A8J2TQZ8_9BACI|nr:beta-N-acetylhexosaminidase [Compostibacillus humi]GFZ88521.1 hypothetical protein GCM10010978_30100 [Compostibacillus humi]